MVWNWKKNKKYLYVILILSVLVVIAGYSSVVYAASGTGSTTQIQNDRGIFDPFSLSIVLLTSEDGTVSRPPIRITTRPPLRSYFRPPFVF